LTQDFDEYGGYMSDSQVDLPLGGGDDFLSDDELEALGYFDDGGSNGGRGRRARRRRDRS
jgi:hypothetical protein